MACWQKAALQDLVLVCWHAVVLVYMLVAIEQQQSNAAAVCCHVMCTMHTLGSDLHNASGWSWGIWLMSGVVGCWTAPLCHSAANANAYWLADACLQSMHIVHYWYAHAVAKRMHFMVQTQCAPRCDVHDYLTLLITAICYSVDGSAAVAAC